MQMRKLHDWDLAPAAAIALQRELAMQIVLYPPLKEDDVTLIAGVDVSSTKFDSTLTAGIIVWNCISGHIVETTFAQAPATFPYIPGLLSFREIPILVEAFKRLLTKPDLIMVDGQGIAHPRRLGIASHLGLLIDSPTIGVAKSRLTGTEGALQEEAGSTAPLTDGGETIGMLVRSKERSKPLYISPGNRIDLASSVALTMAALRGYRLPEPTRLAHLHVNLVRTTGKGLPLNEMMQEALSRDFNNQSTTP